jgi:hypothetical protein
MGPMAHAPLSDPELAQLRRFLDADEPLRRALGREPLLATVVEQCGRLLATLEARERERDEARQAEQASRQALLDRDLPPPGLLPGPGPRDPWAR